MFGSCLIQTLVQKTRVRVLIKWFRFDMNEACSKGLTVLPVILQEFT